MLIQPPKDYDLDQLVFSRHKDCYNYVNSADW